MNLNTRTSASLFLAVITAATLSACGSASSGSSTAAATSSAATTSAATTNDTTSASPSTDNSASPSESMDHATMPGAYLDQAAYESQMAQRAGTKVVYFFHAPWCPDCRATDAALLSSGVPEGLTVVKVDFDTATDLRQKYGVTQQHTFVQVGSDGDSLGKWTGSADGAAILSRTT